VAEAHGVLGQHPEGVVGVGRQLEVGRGAGARHLRHVVPAAAGVVQGVQVLDQELWQPDTMWNIAFNIRLIPYCTLLSILYVLIRCWYCTQNGTSALITAIMQATEQ